MQEIMHLILYSKPGCHLCENLHEKLEQITEPKLTIEIRDITTKEEWFNAYQYAIPVLCKQSQNSSDTEPIEKTLPRLSPRCSVKQIQEMLKKYSEE